LDLVFYRNYFSFSHANPNPTHLPKHKSLSPNHQSSVFSTYLLCSLKYFSVHAYMAWNQKFPGPEMFQIWDFLFRIRLSSIQPKFTMFLHKKWPHRLLLPPKLKNDSSSWSSFSHNFDSGPSSRRKTRRLGPSGPWPPLTEDRCQISDMRNFWLPAMCAFTK